MEEQDRKSNVWEGDILLMAKKLYLIYISVPRMP